MASVEQGTAGSQIAEGAIRITPEVTQSTSNKSDSSADTTVDQDVSNVFGTQDTSLGGVDASASFAPVSLAVSPVIQKGTSANKSGISAFPGGGFGLVAVAVCACLGFIVYLRRPSEKKRGRRRKHGSA